MTQERLTRQELLNCAHALRRAARLSEKDAANPGFTSMRATFAESARSQDELAAKVERIAEAMPAEQFDRRKL
jgi:hypothetical protein